MTKLNAEFTVKTFDDDQGIFTGIASTPTPDRVNDIVEPKGAIYSLPMPLLAYHNHEKVVGTVNQVKLTDAGIEVTGRVLKGETTEATEHWALVKSGALRGLSLGFRGLESKPLANGGRHFTKYEWLELSLVPVAMNREAKIIATKSANPNPKTEGKRMSISQQIKEFETKRADALGKMDALLEKGEVLSAEDEAEFLAIEESIPSIDAHISRLKAAEARQMKSAVAVANPYIEVRDNAPKGQDFVRFTKAMALSRGNPMQALEIAKGMKFGNRVETVLKAAVGAGSTTAAGFTALVENQTMTNEFIELLRPATILGKLTPRIVPQNIRIPKATSGTTASWIGEGKAAPVTNAAFSDMEVGEHKIGAIAVFTEELLRRSEPAAENLVRDDLLSAITTAIDLAFIDRANAGVAGVKPAAISNGASAIEATVPGPNVTGLEPASSVRLDVERAYKQFINANHPLASGVWILHPSLALHLSMVRDIHGNKSFEGLTMNGGTLEGLPVVVSTNVPGNAIDGYDMVLAVQNDILVAEGGLVIDASNQASLEFETEPTGNAKAPTAAGLISLWQTGSVAIKAVRGVTWNRRRPTAVVVITGAKYA